MSTASDTITQGVGQPLTDEAPETPLLDQAVIAGLESDLGREAMGELLTLFHSEAERRQHRIEAAVASGDAAAAASEAHALKGSALSMGAQALGTLALRLERAGRDGDLALLQREVVALARLVAESNAALTRAL
jgi:HPt (histidine-containing phosphotransfer) domain-containing protein